MVNGNIVQMMEGDLNGNGRMQVQAKGQSMKVNGGDRRREYKETPSTGLVLAFVITAPGSLSSMLFSISGHVPGRVQGQRRAPVDLARAHHHPDEPCHQTRGWRCSPCSKALPPVAQAAN